MGKTRIKEKRNDRNQILEMKRKKDLRYGGKARKKRKNESASGRLRAVKKESRESSERF